MKANAYDFRQFQQELAALDRKGHAHAEPPSTPGDDSAGARLLRARTEFTALRERHGLTIAHVVAFFPEEEGIAFLQKLISGMEAKPRRRSKSANPAPP